MKNASKNQINDEQLKPFALEASFLLSKFILENIKALVLLFSYKFADF
jgi:hypothetical protein